MPVSNNKIFADIWHRIFSISPDYIHNYANTKGRTCSGRPFAVFIGKNHILTGIKARECPTINDNIINE